ncbi:MAG: glutamate--tRNA ligase, partial [Clostridia bacterium]|nr:glutamate--tRNA ligase [Clostridia bacterium]
NDISKIIISKMTSAEVYEKVSAWAKEFDKNYFDILSADPDYSRSVFAIDRDGSPKPRKDIAKWNEVKDFYAYMFNDLFVPCHEMPENLDIADIKAFLSSYIGIYDETDDRRQWFERIKALAPQFGFAADTKEYKANPDSYKGSAGDLSTVLRIAVTGRRNTPDLCSIMQVLGKEECLKRINSTIEVL